MISTKGRYALRVMIDLAEQNSAGYIPLNEIATRQQISEKYLEIILKVLVKNKLLEGQRGKEAASDGASGARKEDCTGVRASDAGSAAACERAGAGKIRQLYSVV